MRSQILTRYINMSLIVEGLYLGDYTHATSKQWLKTHNVTHIVNCAKEHKNYFENDFVYLELKLDDSEGQEIYNAMERSYVFINNALELGGTVLVHCHAGISRSSSMIIYYLMKKYRLPFDRAYAIAKYKRNQVSPNAGFVQQLISVTPQVRFMKTRV